MNVGVNIFSLRKILEENNINTWHRLKEIGIDYVELMMFENKGSLKLNELTDEMISLIRVLRKCVFTYDDTARVIQEIRENQLDVESIHVRFDKTHFLNPAQFANNLIAFGQKSQIRNFVIGVDDALDQIKEITPAINQVATMLKQEDMQLVYHNHDKECSKFEESTYLEYLIDHCPDLSLEVDVGWLYVAGMDVISFLKKYRDRLSYIHLKDLVIDDNHITFKAIGYGEVPILETLIFAKTKGFADRLIIDQDDSEDILSDLHKGIAFVHRSL